MLLRPAIALMMGINTGTRFFPNRSLFGSGEAGLWYDLNDDSTIFQDSAGTTLATWGDPVGLTLDKSRWDGRGVVNRLLFSQELGNAAWTKSNVVVTENTTVAPDGTTTADTVTGSAGTALKYITHNTDAALNSALATFTIFAKEGTHRFIQVSIGGDATKYVNFDLNGSGATAAFGSGVTSFVSAAANGFLRLQVTLTGAASTNRFFISLQDSLAATREASTASTGNIILWGGQSQLGSTATAYQANGASVGGPGNHAIQSTSGSRPIRGRMPKRGRVNLVVSSEDVSNSYWSTGSIAITRPSADTIVETTAASTHFLASPTTPAYTVGVAFTKTVTLKKGSLASAPDIMQLTFPSGGFGVGQWANVNVTTGAVESVTGATCTALGADPNVTGGWRFSYTATTTSAGTGSYLVVLFCNNNAAAARAPSYVGSTTADCKVYRMQTEQASAPTAYQHVIDSLGFNVTESGQPSCGYLSFNGSNQWMQTAAAVDFSATDEMSVFAGGRVSAEVATVSQNLIEHTADAGSTDGSFEFSPAPSNSTIKLGDNRYRSRGTAIATATNTGLTTAPRFFVCTGLSDISADTCLLRQNGTQVATSATDQGTGNYANAVTYFGARAGSSLFFNGLVFSTIIRGALTSGTLLTRTEQYVARATPTVNL
jgi:hypothetical protein